MLNRRLPIIVLAAVVLLITAGQALAGYAANWLWFDELGDLAHRMQRH